MVDGSHKFVSRAMVILNIEFIMRAFLLFLCIACAAFSGFVYTSEGPSKEAAPSPAALAGIQLWQDKNCQSCHQLYGLGGYMGPDLTNVARRGDQYMSSFLKSGTERMPDFQLSEAEIDQICAFLHWANQSGSSKVSADAVHWTGSYIIKP